MAKKKDEQSGADKRVIIVMPLAMHTDLKAWCDERGIPLAAGIKLAIKDFLDSKK